MAGAERLELSTVGFGDRRSTIRTTPLYRMGYMIDESRFLVNTYFSRVPPPNPTLAVGIRLGCGKLPGVKFPSDFSTAYGGCACTCRFQGVGFFFPFRHHELRLRAYACLSPALNKISWEIVGLRWEVANGFSAMSDPLFPPPCRRDPTCDFCGELLRNSPSRGMTTRFVLHTLNKSGFT